MRILVIHPGALGDVILALPALGWIRKTAPGAEITFAGNAGLLGPILAGYAERVVSLSALPLYRLFSPDLPSETDTLFWKSYDRIVSWTGSGNGDFVRNLRSIHPDARIAPWRPAPGEARHVSRLFVDSLDLPPLPTRDISPACIRPGAAALEEGERWLLDHGWDGSRALAMLHPGAGSPGKRWPPENFIGLARRLACRNNLELILMEGPAEPGLARRIAGAVPGALPCEGVALGPLAGILSRCRFFVGNDSGVTHLAAALGVPTVALFGPTAPGHWAPLGEHVAVLQDGAGCPGCASGAANHLCLENITVDRVLGEVRRLAGEGALEQPGVIGDVADKQQAPLVAIDAARAPEAVTHDE